MCPSSRNRYSLAAAHNFFWRRFFCGISCEVSSLFCCHFFDAAAAHTCSCRPNYLLFFFTTRPKRYAHFHALNLLSLLHRTLRQPSSQPAISPPILSAIYQAVFTTIFSAQPAHRQLGRLLQVLLIINIEIFRGCFEYVM